ncbi:hypothetical protein PspLS_03817, partial [Pyricularia sp. CBS 133598]
MGSRRMRRSRRQLNASSSGRPEGGSVFGWLPVLTRTALLQIKVFVAFLSPALAGVPTWLTLAARFLLVPRSLKPSLDSRRPFRAK